jgi:hypothetical protein
LVAYFTADYELCCQHFAKKWTRTKERDEITAGFGASSEKKKDTIYMNG